MNANFICASDKIFKFSLHKLCMCNVKYRMRFNMNILLRNTALALSVIAIWGLVNCFIQQVLQLPD
ncbi:conserved hypothetical protein [Trichinella spiralis]|uniref:hypothetical protein n=1 Tax=Trichinella spiralis TaxID=6334 RepID=UPI0001EFEE57|nr:conserved hypothetical protein [Trichinella spiralis]